MQKVNIFQISLINQNNNKNSNWIIINLQIK